MRFLQVVPELVSDSPGNADLLIGRRHKLMRRLPDREIGVPCKHDRLVLKLLPGILLFLMTGPAAHAELVRLQGEINNTSATAGRVVVLGNVKTVLDGESTGSQVVQVEPGTFTAAFGAGSVVSDPEQQGETLVLGDTVFVKTVTAATNYKTTSSKVRPYYSSFIAGISKDAKPAATYSVQGTTMSMEDIYRQLSGVHGPLFAVAGQGDFETLEASAIKRAPCYGEPILGANKDKYFHAPAVMKEVKAVTFGLVLRSAADATSATSRVFYINPDDRGSTGVMSHSHFARLRSSEGINPAEVQTAAPQVEEVAHLLTQSRVRSGTFVVYELKPGAS